MTDSESENGEHIWLCGVHISDPEDIEIELTELFKDAINILER
jgi:hypothetical protein